MEVIVDQLDIDDLVECSDLYVSTFIAEPWNETWNKDDAFDRLNDFLSSPNSVALKAVCNNEILGFLIGENQAWNGEKFHYLKEICVHNSKHRQGIGKNLMNSLEAMMNDHGVSRIYLITQRDSVPSEFYSRLGYTENTNIMVMGKAVGESS